MQSFNNQNTWGWFGTGTSDLDSDHTTYTPTNRCLLRRHVHAVCSLDTYSPEGQGFSSSCCLTLALPLAIRRLNRPPSERAKLAPFLAEAEEAAGGGGGGPPDSESESFLLPTLAARAAGVGGDGRALPGPSSSPSRARRRLSTGRRASHTQPAGVGRSPYR